MVESISKSSTGILTDLTSKAAMKVLHVDDDLNFLKVAGQCLKMQGRFQVDTARSVEEAMEMMEKETYDAIISDFQMPGKDGLEFLKELREEGNSIPFIIFTGKGREEVVIRALSLGADGYFNKHGEPETVYGELAHGIRQTVERKRDSEALHESESKSRTLLENLPQKIFFKDKNAVYISCNENYARDLKIKSDEIAGRTDYDFYPKELAEKYRADDKRIMKSGNSEDIDEEYVQDGQKVFVHTVKTPVKDENGNVVGVLGIFWDITERKKAEEALRQSMENYRELTESISDMFFAMDKDFRYTYWNKASEKLTGIPAKDAIGKSLTEVFPDVKGTGVEQFYKEALRTQQPQRYLSKYQLKGKDYVFEINAHPAKSGLSVFVKDTTERKEAEQTLKESAERYRDLVELAPDGIAAVNAEGIITSANRSFLTLIGYSSEVVVGKPFTELKSSRVEDTPKMLEMFESLMKGESPSPVEFLYVRKDGTSRWAEVHASLLTKDGNPVGALVIMRDVTERRNAEKLIQENQQKFEQLFTCNPEAAVYVDQNERVLSVNPRFTELYGYSFDEVKGEFLDDFVVPEDRKKEALMLAQKGREGYVFFETVRKNKKGSLIPVTMSSAPIVLQGQHIGDMVLYKDITERKKVEEEKSRLLHDLQERAKELNCFYGMSRLFEKSDISLDAVLQGTADLLPPAMQYPDIACARIVAENREFSTKNFKETGWKLQADIEVHGKKAGFVEVRHLEERPAIAEDPFLKEERLLIDAIAERLGKITERKKAEETLQESEERFRAIFEGANDGILATDAKTRRFFLANPRICEITGYSLEELLKLGVGDIVPKKDLAYVIDSIEKQMQGKVALSRDVPVLRKDGRVVYCDVSSKPMKIGNQEYLVGLFRDVTELRKSGEALRDAKQKWASLTANTDDIVMIVDSEGIIQYINRTIPPYTPEETIGKTVYEYVPREQHDTMRSSLKKTFETGIPFNYVVSSNIPKIGTVWFETKVVPVKDDEKTVSVILMSTDVTKLRNTEERLKETNMKLEDTNEKLRVVGGLTRHDARNKLSAVTGNAYLLRRKLAEDPKALEQLNDMETAVRLVEKIFEFARAYEKLGTEQLVSIDVGKAVDGAGSLFSGLKGVKIVNECGGLTVLADSLLSQLFYNLIDNSLKYGEKTRQIRVYYKMSRSDQLELVYEDDGVGIPDNMRGNLFKEGFTSGKGTGYGLFMIKRMCGVYGWTIQETGIQGKGARFILTVPEKSQQGKPLYKLP
jgi:PAS domain S-box-containing protein